MLLTFTCERRTPLRSTKTTKPNKDASDQWHPWCQKKCSANRQGSHFGRLTLHIGTLCSYRYDVMSNSVSEPRHHVRKALT